MYVFWNIGKAKNVINRANKSVIGISIISQDGLWKLKLKFIYNLLK